MLQHETIKSLFLSAVLDVTSHIHDYAVRPGLDFSRTRKFPPEKLIRFLVAQGASSTRVEMLDFFGFNPQAPTSSAFCQQRAKLKSTAIRAVLDTFNRSLFELEPAVPRAMPGYRCLFLQHTEVLIRGFLCLGRALHQRFLQPSCQRSLRHRPPYVHGRASPACPWQG